MLHGVNCEALVDTGASCSLLRRDAFDRKMEITNRIRLLKTNCNLISVMGYTPYFMMYGRRARMPLTKALTASLSSPFGNRLDDLSECLRQVRVRGAVVWIRHQQTGKTRVVNRCKIKIVDPNVIWDDVRPRPVRNSSEVSCPHS